MVLKDYVLAHLNQGHKTLRFMFKEYIISKNDVFPEIRILTPSKTQIVSAKNLEDAAEWIANDMLRNIATEWGPNDVSGS